MKNNDFSALFYNICKIKKSIVKLDLKKLETFKGVFFSLDFPEWRLQLLWEYIWDDKTYEEVFYIFDKKNLLKK